MPLPVYRGSGLPVPKLVSTEFDPVRGWTSYATFGGVSLAALTALQNSYASQSIASRLKFENGVASLDIIDSTQQYTIDNWQIAANELTQSIFNHPNLLSVIRNSDDLGALIGLAQAPNTTYSSVITTFVGKGYTNPQATVIAKFFSLNQRGTTDFVQAQYVLRHTTNVSNRSTANVADFGVDQIYNPAQLVAEISNGTLWDFPAPTYITYRVANIPAGPTIADYLWGWLKHGSTSTTEANNRVAINTEYVLANWSTVLYSPFAG